MSRAAQTSLDLKSAEVLRLTAKMRVHDCRSEHQETDLTIRVHHLNCGTMCPYCERFFTGQGSVSARARLVCHCLLVETPQGHVLVDTGLGTADMQQPERRLGKGFFKLMNPRLSLADTAFEQIKGLGLNPCDVKHIVPTHLDSDHTGGLSDFPMARVHVHKRELAPALSPVFPDSLRFRKQHFQHHPKWAVHEHATESWFGFQAIRPVANLPFDLLMIPLFGHTRGHVGVAVRNGGKWLLHCGDAYYHRAQMTADEPVPKGIKVFETLVQTLPEKRKQSLNCLQQLSLDHGHEIDLFCAHDPLEFDRMLSSAFPS